MNNSKTVYIISLLLFSFLLCFAQEIENIPPPQSLQKESPIKKTRPTFVVGGSFGAQFGSFGSAVGIAPQVGVYSKPWLLVLLNGQYTFMWRTGAYNANIWGLGAALQPLIIKRIVIHVGYEFEQYNFHWLDNSPKQAFDFHFAVLGAGYKHYMSKKVFFQALILFNIPLNQPKIINYSYGYYPFFRIGMGVDL